MAYRGETDKSLDPLHQAALTAISAAVVLGDRDILLINGRKLPDELLKITAEKEKELRQTVDRYGMDALNNALTEMRLSRLTDMPSVLKIYPVE